jgi:ribosomal protein S27AE
MMRLKACPRCCGDLVLTSYFDERSLSCLQCGYARTLLDADNRPEDEHAQVADMAGAKRRAAAPVRTDSAA